ncbi:MAG TPA: cellulase family glycosylhydrolase [Nitrososphaera sp.]|nr:cellulase family glycosylhydrolase [Nitrososphaera sp.]
MTTVRSFDGSEYLDVASNPSLQLSQFVIEVRFMSSSASATGQNMFLVSKSSGSVDNAQLDHNYALFINKYGELSGGFEADDGTVHYLNTDVKVTDSKWHVARIIYDGIKLKLKLDGTLSESGKVGKAPSSAGKGPLRIGANANSGSAGDSFFVGSIDYVKMLDRMTFKKVYFNDFGAVVNPEPGSEPSTDPEPEPKPSSTSCADMPMREVKGTVFMDHILSKREGGGSFHPPADYVSESMRHMKMHGFNAIRVPYYWESYVNSPTQFLDELEVVARAADDYDICVIYDNHHWYTSSYWNIDIIGNSDGRGFPSIIVKNFPVRNNDYEDTAGPFWKAFLTNNIDVGGKKVWDLQADFFAKVINRIVRFDSVMGYEIMNEPHLFSPDQYDDLGNYHTFMAKKIREITDKKIFFDRETARGFQREPDSEVKVVPFGVSGVLYGPHLYAVPYPGTQAEKQLANFKQWSQDWKMEILVGEWSAETQEENDAYLHALKENGFGWTYYSWKPTVSRGGGSTLYDSSTTDPTAELRQLTSSMERVY